MRRTTLMLPEKLKALAESAARKRDESLGEFVRVSIQERLVKSNGSKRDALFADDFTFTDNFPADVSANLDNYLSEIFDTETSAWTAGKKRSALKRVNANRRRSRFR